MNFWEFLDNNAFGIGLVILILAGFALAGYLFHLGATVS